MAEEKLVCFYCLDNSLSVGICLSCRSKKERAEQDLKWYMNQAARERAGFFRLAEENRKLREENAKLRKRK